MAKITNNLVLDAISNISDSNTLSDISVRVHDIIKDGTGFIILKGKVKQVLNRLIKMNLVEQLPGGANTHYYYTYSIKDPCKIVAERLK
jgi:hypothetical protein